MSRQFMYVIRKDGLYLLGLQQSGIREIDSSGVLVDVYTCIWGNDRSCAKAFQHRKAAEEIAKQLDADGVESFLTEVENHVDDERGS